MCYSKTLEYLTSLKQICNMLFIKSKKQDDRKLHLIAWMVLNYFIKYTRDMGIEPKDISDNVDNINITPIIDYIHVNNISLFDLNNINNTDLDVNEEHEIERFVLTHLAYMFFKEKI